MAHLVQVVAIDGPDGRCNGWRVLSATTGDAATTADDATATNLCSPSAIKLEIPILAALVLATVAAPVNANILAASVAVPAGTGPVAGS
jgi:hypothetical protein